MRDPFVGRRTLTPEQWRARGEAIQARLRGLSIDELMRGDYGAEAPRPGAHGQRRGGYNSDGGQWTGDDRWAGRRWPTDRRDRLRDALQFAAGEPPPLDPRRWRRWLARKLIEGVHRELAKWDLFGQDPDKVTVAVTTMDGEAIIGTSSTYGDWHPIDQFEARALRATIMRKYRHLWRPNSGYIPLDAFFHAEANLLLRAARKNGRSLAGKSLDVFVDNETCANCKEILGPIGLELGNPTLTFINSTTGRVMGVVRDGKWLPQ
jgi:hypothetical protein